MGLDLLGAFDHQSLAIQSWDLTTLQTPLSLLHLTTLPMGATNSVQILKGDISFIILSRFVPPAKSQSIDHYIGGIGCDLTNSPRSHRSNQLLSRLIRPLGWYPLHSRWKPELGSDGYPKALGTRDHMACT